MEGLDWTKEQQVWQRVRGSSPPPQRLELRAMQLSALENWAAYRRAAASLSGAAREQLRHLQENARAQADSISGIHRLTTGTPLPRKEQPAPAQPAEKLLRGCYHRAYRALAEYTMRSAEGETGTVFQTLAHLAAEECAAIARLLGQI